MECPVMCSDDLRILTYCRTGTSISERVHPDLWLLIHFLLLGDLGEHAFLLMEELGDNVIGFEGSVKEHLLEIRFLPPPTCSM